MIKWIYIEVVHILKKRKSKAIFVIVSLLITLMMSTENYLYNTDTTEEDALVDIINISKTDKDLMCDLVKDDDLCQTTTNLYQNSILELNAFKSKNYTEYLRLRLFRNISTLQTYLLDQTSEELQVREGFENIYQELEGIQNGLGIESWELANPIDLGNNVDGFTNDVTYLLNAIKIDFYHYTNQIPIALNHELTPLTVVGYYFQYYYIILIGLAILMTFDTISNDIDNGSIKTYATSPISRFKYILVKCISGIIATIIVLILPILLISLCLAFLQGFDSYKQLTLQYENSFSQLTPITPYSRMVVGNASNYEHIYNVSTLSNTIFPNHDNFPLTYELEIMKLSKLIISTIVHSILFIIYTSTLNVFLTSIFKKKVMVVAISFLLLMIGISISYILRGNIMDFFNIYSYLNTISIINGTLPYTYLSGTILVTFYVLILLCLSKYFFHKMDI